MTYVFTQSGEHAQIGSFSFQSGQILKIYVFSFNKEL